MRTPFEMADQINSLNCHGSQSTHNPVTVAQMEAIYAEARNGMCESLNEVEKELIGIVEYWNGNHSAAVDAIETVIDRVDKILGVIRSMKVGMQQ